MNAQKLQRVHAAIAAASGFQPGPMAALHAEIQDLTAQDLAELIVRDIPLHGASYAKLHHALHSQMELVLIREQLAAQERSSKASEDLAATNNKLSKASNWLAAAAGFFGLIQIAIAIIQLRSCS